MSRPLTRDGWGWIAAAALGGLGGLTALACARAAPGSFDECSFQAALTAWDLLAFEPHFPGYPLCVLGARLLASAGAAAPYAALAALLLPLSALALHRGAGGGPGGLLAAGLFALAPSCVREAARPMADVAGAACLAIALGLAAAYGSRAALAAGLAAGAAAGAKPDLLPWLALGLPVCLAAPGGERARVGLRFALGAAGPLLLALTLAAEGAGGLGPLLREGRRFLGGHLFEWGGGVTAAASGSRLGVVLPLGQAAGATTAAAATGTLLLLLLLALRAPRWARRGAVLAGLPYLAWALLGQNPDQPRHALPLLPPLALLAGLGLGRCPARSALRAALTAGVLLGAGSGLTLALAARARPRPSDDLCAWAARLDPLRVRLYAGSSGRVLRARVPLLDVRRTRGLDALAQDLRSDPAPPPLVLVLSEVPGAERLPVLTSWTAGLSVHRLGGEQTK